MTPRLSLLYFLIALLLLFGVLSISIIILVSKKFRTKSDNKNDSTCKDIENLDIWTESAKRLEDDYPEHDK